MVKPNILILETQKHYFPNLYEEERFKALSKKFQGFVLAKGYNKFQKIKQSNFMLYLAPKSNLLHKILFPFILIFTSIYLIIKNKIDLVITTDPITTGICAIIIKILTGKKIVINLRGDSVEVNEILGKSKIKIKIMNTLSKFTIKHSDAVWYISNNLKDKYLSKKSFIINEYVPVNYLFKQKTKRNKKIYFAGFPYKSKGLLILLKAFKSIQNEFPNFRLIIAGYDDMGKWKEIAKNLEIKNIVFRGSLKYKQLISELKDCYLACLPSYSEGLCRFLIEAQALGKPVIASDNTGMKESVKNKVTGYLIKTGDYKELAEKLRILLKNKKKAKEMGKAGRKFVRTKFSEKKHIDEIYKMYLKIK